MEKLNTFELYLLKQINDIDCLSKIQLINNKLNANFTYLVNSINTNLNHINLLIKQNGILGYNTYVVFFIFNSKIILDLLNRLYFVFIYWKCCRIIIKNDCIKYFIARIIIINNNI